MGKYDAQMIAIDAAALQRIETQIAALTAMMQNAQIKPREEWLTIHEASKEWGISAPTIRRKAQAGEIEVKGTGKARRYRF